MRQRIIQALYQALPDKNVPLYGYSLERETMFQFGRRLLEAFPDQTAQWALVCDPGKPQSKTEPVHALAAVFTAPHSGGTPQRLASPQFENAALQQSSWCFARALLAGLDLAPSEQKMVWLLVSAKDVKGAVPPLLSQVPGFAPGSVDVSRLPKDTFIKKLAKRFASPPDPEFDDLQEEMGKRLEFVLKLSAPTGSSSLDSLITDDFRRGVAHALGSQYGYSLEERFNGRAAAPEPSDVAQPKQPSAESLVAATGFAVQVGEHLASLVEELAYESAFDPVREFTRKHFGFDLPVQDVKVAVGSDLPASRVQLLYRNGLVAQGDFPSDRLLVRGARDCLRKFAESIEVHPVDGAPLAWVAPELAASAGELGCPVYSHVHAVLEWMQRAVFMDPCGFFNTQSAQQLLEETRHTHPGLVDECLRLNVTARWVRRLGCLLLRQRIGLHDRVTFLDALLDGMEWHGGPQMDEKKLVAISMEIRRQLRCRLQVPWMTPQGGLPVLQSPPEAGPHHWKQQLGPALELWPHVHPPVLIVPKAMLGEALVWTREHFPTLPVLGEHEIVGGTRLFPAYPLQSLQ